MQLFEAGIDTTPFDEAFAFQIVKIVFEEFFVASASDAEEFQFDFRRGLSIAAAFGDVLFGAAGGCAALLSSFSPPLASSYGGCAATLPSLLASLLPLLHPPSYGGFAAHFLRPSLALSAPPSPLVGGSPPHSPPLALVGGWRRPLAPLSYTMKSRLSETHMGIGVPLSPDCENQRFSCQGLLRLSLSEACFVTVACHELFFFCLLP